MKRLVVGGIYGLVIIGALVDPINFSSPKKVWLWWAVQAALLLIMAGMFICYLFSYYRKEIRTGTSRTISNIGKVPEQEAYELQRVAGRMGLNAMQARIFALGILEPAELRQRVSESHTPAQRTLRQDVTVDAQIPDRWLSLKSDAPASELIDATGTNVLFPILILPKGSFNDNLEVYGADEERVPVLSYREYLQLTAGILRLLLCQAYGVPAKDRQPRFPQPTSGSADDDVIHLEHRALCAIIKRAQANAEAKKPESSYPLTPDALEVAKLLEQLPVDESKRVYLRLAGELVLKLSLHYALVALTRLGPRGRILIRYRRTLIPELDLSPDEDVEHPNSLERAYRRSKGWLRILFGARPVNVTVSLDNAWTCQSYHVRVEAPDGLYLARQEFVTPDGYMSLRAKGAPTDPHYRFRRRLGQPYAHFYGRFFPIPSNGMRRPKVKLDFVEVPPGSDFRAAVASLACLGLVWVVGFVMSRTQDPGTDAPAFLLLFPGVAASWLGFDVPSHRLFEGTLAARLSLALTTITSVAASTVFIMNRSGLSFLSGAMPYKSSLLGANKWPWAALILLAFANTIYTIHRWLRQTWQFKHLAERPDPGA